MMSGKRCETCKFWCSPEQIAKEQDEIVPSTAPNMANEWDMGQCRRSMTRTWFGTTYRNQWCGDYQPND